MNPLKDYLTRKDLTVKEFAEISNIPERTVASYVYEGKRPDKYLPNVVTATNGELTANHFYNAPPGQ